MTASGFPLPFVAGYRLCNCTRLSWLWAIPVEGGGHSSPITGKTAFLICPVCRSAFHVAASKGSLCSSYPISAGSLPKGEAFLMQAGATCKGVPPHFPTGIGFDPCAASALSSEGRGGRFYGTHADCSFFPISITYGLSIRLKCYPLNP